ncbi:hypothetical protein LQF12_03200 [Ruania suaedae]|uniref:hypothetical protein n=1 Tax=Ruania suaedae TaxID=2897774 RepID=UPI001E2E45EE|nr:hypothetical protein [Ruania suaedae]UFU03631.1 hypothetical protein LQF12_03200 [Ruania suaedae]
MAEGSATGESGEDEVPGEETTRRRRHRRVVRPGTGPEPLVDRRLFDAEEQRREDGSDDDRFLRDVPPHWS